MTLDTKNHSPQQRTLHLIANAHLDPVWLWRWPEGCTEIRGTCRAAADFLEQDRSLRFVRSSAGDLRWIAELEPKLLARIRKLVKAGQWESVGGWWTQPDCNIPSGESFVRQGLYGQQWFQKHLGRPAKVGYNVDSFGHHANLPQLLAKSGIPYYVFMRPTLGENAKIPQGYFEWEGVDGTRVKAYRLFHPYNFGAGGWGEEGFEEALKHLESKGGQSRMVFWGMGDHGGGPTRQGLAWFEERRKKLGTPSLVQATVSEAFRARECEGGRWPVYKGELQIHAAGCYAAHSEIKELNRRAEEALLAAERLAALATMLLKVKYPAKELSRAWQDVLFNQFHDILAGSSMREAYRDAREQMGRALFTAAEVANAARQQLAAQIDTRGQGQAMVVFNPHPFPVEGVVETGNLYGGAQHWWVNFNKASFFTAEGQELPLQWIEGEAKCGGCQYFVLPVKVPALGYQVLWAREGRKDRATAGRVRAQGKVLENGRLRVVVGARGIAIKNLQTGREVLRAGGIAPLVIDDPSDTWGHDYTRFDQVAGRFKLQGVRIMEAGPLRGRLRAEYAFGKSRLWLDLLLEDGRSALEIRAKAWWLERRRILKIAFPVNVRATTSTHEIPYAALERANDGLERPIQQWVDLSDKKNGVAVINEGKYSVSVEGNELRQTVLRSAPYAWSKCKMYPWKGENVDWKDEHWYQDQGVQEFRLLVLVHDGDWRKAGVMQAARQFNQPLALQGECAHAGPLAPTASLVETEGPVLVAAVKQAEDGRDLIVRAVETNGRRGMGRFRLPTLGIKWTAQFGPWEIKTFRIRGRRVREMNLLEQSLRDEDTV